MSKDCDYGIALWDSKSIGTAENIKRLHSLGKKIIVCTVMISEPTRLVSTSRVGESKA